MPFLILQYNQKVVKQIPVSLEKRIRIGRNEKSDIQLDDSAVSGLHAEIESEGGLFYITDFNSRNGTFVNKELILSRQLAHGDAISIGNHSLVFAYGSNEAHPAASEEMSHEATMHIDTPGHRQRLARSVAELAGREIESSVEAMVTVLDRTDASIAVDKPCMTIGKHPDSDIVVKGWFVADTAARIQKRNDGFYLTPVQGKPPRLNSLPVRADSLLNEFDIIEIGSTALQFHFRSAVENNRK